MSVVHVGRRGTDAAAPGALAGTKALTRGPDAVCALREELEHLSTVSAHYFSSAEGREGLAAFAEKRKPFWSN